MKYFSFLIWLFLLVGVFYMLYTFEYFFDFFHYFDAEYMAKKGYTFADMFMRRDIDFWNAKKDKVNDYVWVTALYLHVIGCFFAITIGPFQFIKAFRDKYLKLHRNLGKIYLGSIFFLGVPTGGYMAIFANGGLWAQIGFTILTFLWLGSTYLAYKYVREMDIEAHQRWMIRSYAITFAAATLRFWTMLLSAYPEIFINLGVLDVRDAITASCAWLAWIPNIIVAEIIIRGSEISRR